MVNKWLLVKVVFVIIATLCIGCGNSVPPKEENRGEREVVHFTLPEIPLAIVGRENRSRYLAEHYWSNFDFNDTTLIENDSLVGIAVAGYVQALMMNPPSVAERSIGSAMNRSFQSGEDAFRWLSAKLEDALYNPNSPMRDEELYLHLLNYTIESRRLEEIEKIRARTQREMVMKNRLGEAATDFAFETKSGKVSTLYDLHTPYTLLFFNTPDCEECAWVKGYMGRSSYLASLVAEERITLLGIYTEGEFELWRKASYPPIIVNGADMQCQIKRQALYDLKALPTLYLLDSDKRVLLKDRSIKEIEAYLQQHTAH